MWCSPALLGDGQAIAIDNPALDHEGAHWHIIHIDKSPMAI
jgi:hypothetical protein